MAWQGSTRRARLPANWDSELRPRALELNPEQVCHWCHRPGGTTLDHKQRGDHICQQPNEHGPRCQCNLDWIHDHQDKGRWIGASGKPSQRNCHGEKTGREAAAARTPLRRPAEVHPALR